MTEIAGIYSEALKEERLQVCRACPTFRISKLDPTLGIGELFGVDTTTEQPTCGEFGRPITLISCGCLLNLKTPLPLFKCPQKKWIK